jgi:hypothetical protein
MDPNRYPYDPTNLPTRQHEEHIDLAWQAHAEGYDAKVHGIKGYSVLFLLSSIRMPYSFPVDIMHCLHLGAIKALMHHLTSKFFKTADLHDPRFIVSAATFREFGELLEAAKTSTPTSYGRYPRNLEKNFGYYKAEEWMNFVSYWSIPLLYSSAPELPL